METTTQRQVAAAFGTDPVTVWRQDRALRDNRVADLVPAREGPKGPSKLTPELAQRIRELDTGGMTLTAIAAQCGVSTFAVRTALGRVPARPAAAGRPAEGPEPAGGEPAAADAAPHPGPPHPGAPAAASSPPAGSSSAAGSSAVHDPLTDIANRVLFGSRERRHPASR